MKMQYFSPEQDGFYGVYYPNPAPGRKAFIAMLWDTCKYIRRMTRRLETLPHECEVETLIYEHGTHFVFPSPC